MKKEFLKELGLTDEQVESIMKENGIDIEREKAKLTALNEDLENYKEQLQTAQDTLKSFEGVNVDELKGQIENLNKSLSEQEKEYQQRLADRDFNDTLNKAIAELGGKSDKAIRALLDIDTLKASKNQTEDIKNAITQCKTENDFLFGSDEPINNPTGPTGGGLPNPEDTQLVELYTAMGLTADDMK